MVAPPGSGKTLIGLEIARRIGKPAVTFSPTTTIQEQWKDKVRLFVPADGPEADDLVDRHVSAEPERLGELSSLTYQSLGTQTNEREFLDRLGRQAWIDELIDGGRTPEAAEAHVRDLTTRGPEVAAEEIRKRAIRRKRELLKSGEATVESLFTRTRSA